MTLQRPVYSDDDNKMDEKKPHVKPKIFSCELCDFQALAPYRLRRHLLNVHQGLRYECSQCSYRSTRKNHLKRHINIIHNHVRFNCSICDYQATRKDHLKNHIYSVHLKIKPEQLWGKYVCLIRSSYHLWWPELSSDLSLNNHKPPVFAHIRHTLPQKPSNCPGAR